MFDGWAENNPQPNLNARCVAASTDGWLNKNCNEKLQHYVCMGKIQTHAKTAKKSNHYRYGTRINLDTNFIYSNFNLNFNTDLQPLCSRETQFK